MSLTPRAFVLNAPGINCNLETGHAIEQAGAQADQVLLEEWRGSDIRLDDYQMLFVPGGFSYGDDLGSGKLLGTELKTPEFADQLNRFVAAGKAIVGICNGFQTLVETGLLPNGRTFPQRDNSTKELSLVSNANNSF